MDEHHDPFLLIQMKPAHADKAAGMLRALANPSRLMILCKLFPGEQTVGELHADLDLSQSALSQHLARLKKDGLVTTRRDAQRIYYRIKDPGAMEIIGRLYQLYCAPETREE